MSAAGTLGVAQPGSEPRSERGSRRIEASRPDHSAADPDTQLAGFFRLRPGLSPEQLEAAVAVVLAAVADYRKGAGGAGFYEVRVPWR